MTTQAMCTQLSIENKMLFDEILWRRGLTSLRDIPNFDSQILDTNLAYNIAVLAHNGVFDKGGTPYINHPIFVASQFTCTYRISTAYLHDVVEDNQAYSFELLRNQGIHPRVVQALSFMTHSSGSYEDYIRNLSQDPIAVDVKLADMLHNSDISRLRGFNSKTVVLLQRYNAAFRFLAKNNFGIQF